MTAKKFFALLFVLLLLAAGLMYMMNTDRHEQAKVSALYSRVEPLQKERDELVAERNSIELDYALMMRDVSTVQILFREVDESLFDKVYPMMRDSGFTGVIGLTADEIPNRKGKISAEQYDRLIMDGWGSCYVYDSAERLDSWLKKVKWRIENAGLTAPGAIYFSRDSYDSKYDQLLQSYGITTVIIAAEDGRSSTVSDVTGDIWFTGAMPWNYTGVIADTELLARTDGGNLTFTISFNNIWDAYDEDSFRNTLTLLETYSVKDELLSEEKISDIKGSEEVLETPLLKVLNYQEAKKSHQEAVQNNAVLEQRLKDRQNELDIRIAELDKQIREIYDQWQQDS